MVGKNQSRPWTDEEDALLISAVHLHGEHDRWKDVASLVPGRTNKACRKRWLHSLSPTVKKSPWTPIEDDQLVALYHFHGPKWSTIAREIPGRTDDACSKRYREALDPNLKKDEWTPEEDEKLMQLFGEIGGRWAQVGQELQRSGLGCRNRYRHLVTKASKLTFDPPPDEPFLDTTLQQENPSLWSPSLTYYSPDTFPSFPSGDYSGESPVDNLFPDHFPQNHLPSVSPLLSEALSEIRDATTGLLGIFETEQPSSGCDTPDPSSSDFPIPQNAPLLFEQDQDLSRIFSGVQFEGGIFYYREDDHASHSRHVLNDEELWRVPDFASTDCSTQGSFYGSDAPSPDQSNVDNSSSTLSTPFHVSLSLSATTSPGPSTPVELSIMETPVHPVDSSIERTPSPRRNVRRTTHRGIKPLGLARLSSILPLTTDPSVKPYACGRERCWPQGAALSSACFPTSKELLDHIRTDHTQDPVGDKPFRCALMGCGKSWKSLNGLQYHLQLSTAHFRTAMSSRFSSQRSPASNAKRPPEDKTDADTDAGDEGKRIHVCHHLHCFKAYRQASGLRYHLKHGHPPEMPAQIPDVPPALARQLPSKTKKMRRKTS